MCMYTTKNNKHKIKHKHTPTVSFKYKNWQIPTAPHDELQPTKQNKVSYKAVLKFYNKAYRLVDEVRKNTFSK